MRYRSDDIHPVLWKAVDELTGRIYSGQANSSAILAHQTEWLREYGPDTLKQLIAPLLLLGAGFFMAIEKMPKQSTVLVMVLAIIWIVAVVAMKASRNFREMTPRELELLLPELKFEGVGRAYAEAVLAVGQASLPEESRSETLQELKRVMDEHERIERARAHLTGAAKNRPALEAEVAQLRDKASAARDPQARSLFEESLAVAEARLAGTENQAATGERLEAQAELLRQSVLRVRDTLAIPSVETATEGTQLRQALAGVRARAEAVEAAVKELEAW